MRRIVFTNENVELHRIDEHVKKTVPCDHVNMIELQGSSFL